MKKKLKGDQMTIHNLQTCSLWTNQILIQIKEELLTEIEKESEDIDRTCREFLPYSVADYIPELVKALKLQIQQIIKGMCK